MKKASPGVRFADWINENEGSDLCFQGRARVAKKVNAMVKAEVMKERRKLLRVCEDFANELDVLRGDWIGSASKAVREVCTKMQNTRSG